MIRRPPPPRALSLKNCCFPPSGRRYHYPVPKIFFVQLSVGSHEFIGEGRTRQAARHNAAMKALQALRDEPIPERPPQVNRFFFFFFFFVFIIITLLASKINCRRHAGRPLAGTCRHISCATSALRNVMKTRTHPDALTKRHFLSGPSRPCRPLCSSKVISLFAHHVLSKRLTPGRPFITLRTR